MDATENGAKQGQHFRLHSHVLQFESMTRQQYKQLGMMKARQCYKTEEKQAAFLVGWIAVNQAFFKMMADGPRRRVTRATITIECDKCGTEEVIEFTGRDVSQFVQVYKQKPCPECQKADRYIDDEFDTNNLERI